MQVASTMEILKQTSKTILFEEFNRDDNVPDLFTILQNNDPTTEMFQLELKKLEVHTFKEFLEKFAPKVYEICQQDENGNIQFMYTTDINVARKTNYRETSITDNVYYKMLSDFYYTKGSSGSSNLEFDDKKILEMLTPKREVEEARNIRKSLKYNLEKYYELKEKGENPSEYAQRFIEDRKRITEQYKNSQMGLLPVAIEDINIKIKLLDEYKSESDNDDVVNRPISGYLAFDNSGELIVQEVKEIAQENDDDTKMLMPRQNLPATITDVLEKDYEKNEFQPNEFVKALITNVYSPMDNSAALTTTASKEELLSNKEKYEKIYVRAKKSFIDEMTQVLEKLLGVKIFFDHATADGGDTGYLKSGLIVSNCPTSRLVSDVKEKFSRFIEDRGINQVEEKIWFAILPAVVDGAGISDNSSSDIDPFADINIDAQEKKQSLDYLDFNTAKMMLKLLDENRIMTIFNFKAGKDNGFGSITASYIRNKREVLSEVNYGHAVYSYPNFTVTRERKVSVAEEVQDEKLMLTVPDVYIDAAYPAAGLLVGSQQTDYLEKHGFKVDKENVCVRVDLENEEIKKNLITKFNRELVMRWNKDIIEEIGKDNFGFVFNSDKIYINNEPIKNTYVYLARTLKKNTEGQYTPIYQILMKDFVLQYLRGKWGGSKVKLANLKQFAKDEVVSWKRASTNEKIVNRILQNGEEVIIENDDEENSNIANLKIKFNKNEIAVEINID